MHHANWRRRGRERKKLVDYRPLFSATIGYETGRRKLPLRFQISIIKLDGIVHRRNRKTMNLRHILRLPLSLSLFRARKNNETFLDTLACPFFQNVFRHFSEFFTHCVFDSDDPLEFMVKTSWIENLT